jgi:esterase/lipase superfamily enzyme
MRIFASVVLALLVAACATQKAPKAGAHHAQPSRAKHGIAVKIAKAPTMTTRERVVETIEKLRKPDGEIQWRLERRIIIVHTLKWSDGRTRSAVVNRSQPAIIASSDIAALQPVFFATNRKIRPGTDLTLDKISSARSSSIRFGLAMVSVPKQHRIGHVERPEPWFFGYLKRDEKDADDFRIKGLDHLSREQFVQRLKANSDAILLFIHGYNVRFEDAIFKAAQIAYDANFSGGVVVFSWPSAGELLKYDYDAQSALFSSGQLLTVMKMLSKNVGGKKIYVVAHSLGNQIVVDALQQAALSGTPLNISELILAAPDVDRDVFMSKAQQIKSVAGNVTIYESSTDKALLASDIKTWGTRMGYVTTAGPNLVKGMEVIDVTAVGDDMFGLNHGTFSANRSVLSDLGHLLLDGKHPPPLRSPTLRRMPSAADTKYWMFPH